MVADKANFTSRPFAVLACFVLFVYGLSWIVEVPAALTTLGLLHVHVSKGLQTLAQLTPAVAALITAGVFFFRRADVATFFFSFFVPPDRPSDPLALLFDP